MTVTTSKARACRLPGGLVCSIQYWLFKQTVEVGIGSGDRSADIQKAGDADY